MCRKFRSLLVVVSRAKLAENQNNKFMLIVGACVRTKNLYSPYFIFSANSKKTVDYVLGRERVLVQKGNNYFVLLSFLGLSTFEL